MAFEEIKSKGGMGPYETCIFFVFFFVQTCRFYYIYFASFVGFRGSVVAQPVGGVVTVLYQIKYHGSGHYLDTALLL